MPTTGELLLLLLWLFTVALLKRYKIMDEENDSRLCSKNMSEDKNIYGYEVAAMAFFTVKTAKIRG